MSKNDRHHKYCNCQISTDKEILRPNVKYSFCQNCGCVLLKNHDGTIYFTLKPKQNKKSFDLSPIEFIRHMKKKTEEEYPFIYEEFNINKSDKHIKEKTLKSLNIYLNHRKMILIKLQKLMKTFNYCDISFYQTLFFLDTYLSHKITADMSEKVILYYLIGYFLCSVKIKETDIYEPSLDSFFDLSKGIYLSSSKIAYYEVLCLKTINYNVFSYSSYDWIMQLISNGVVFNCEVNSNNEIILIKGHRHSLVNTVNKHSLKLLLNITSKNIFFKYSPMHIAISLIQLTREKYIDKNMIKPKLFTYLINLYGVKQEDYKKCYEEIKDEINEMNSENENHHKEKDNNNENRINNHLPELKAHERNESTKKIMKIGKSVYVPNKLKSSNVLVHVPNNLVNNSKNEENTPNELKDDSNNFSEDSKEKEKENPKENKEIELSINETIPKKKYKMKLQKSNISLHKKDFRFSIDCKANNVSRSNQNLPFINLKSNKRYSFMSMNNDETIESTHFKNISQSKNRNRPILKDIKNIRANPNRYNSIYSKDTKVNSSVTILLDKDKERVMEQPNIKVNSKFLNILKNNSEINNFESQFIKKKIKTSTKLPKISEIDDVGFEKKESNSGDIKRNKSGHNHEHHKKKRYKLKTHIENNEEKDKMPEEDIKENKKTKKLIEAL